MKSISLVGWFYLLMGTGTCIYFCAAGMGGWQAPQGVDSSGGSSYAPGSSYGRSWGGSWGGGK